MGRTILAHAEKLFALQMLVETGSFRRAASALGVTPSALSQSISALERRIGSPLVVRGVNLVTATPHGEQLLARATPALSALLTLDAPPSPALPAMKVRLGAYESLAIDAVPGLLSRLSKNQPKLSVTVRTGRSGALLQLLRRGELDAALVAETELSAKLHVEVIAHDELGLYAPPEHVAIREGVSRATRYAGLAPGLEGLPRYYQKLVRAYGLSPTPFIACDSFEALRAITVRQVSCGILPRRIATRTPGQLVLLRGAQPARHAIWLVSRRGLNDPLRDTLATELRAAIPER